MAGVERAQRGRRIGPKVDPVDAATQLWAMTHGVVSLVLARALPPDALDEHLPPMYAARWWRGATDPAGPRPASGSGWDAATPVA